MSLKLDFINGSGEKSASIVISQIPEKENNLQMAGQIK